MERGGNAFAEGPIKRCWDVYEASNVPGDAGRIQREETRKAFYTGAWFVLVDLIEEAGKGAGEDLFRRLVDEAKAFACMNIRPTKSL